MTLHLISLKEIKMFEIEPDNIVVAQNSKLKSIFYVVDGLLIAEAGFKTDIDSIALRF